MSDSSLDRVIGRPMLVVFVIGDILGAGIYALVGKLAGHVGGAVWLPLALGFVVASLTAASYAELVGRYPRAAGAALYAHEAWHRPFLTFLVAFAVLTAGVASASTAALAFGGKYLAELITTPPMLGAAGFLVAITLINLIGISESIKVNLVLTIIEATGLLVVIAVGVISIARGDGDPSRALDLAPPPGAGHGAVLGVIGATALGFYALLGFEDAVSLAEEAKDPQRSFPVALFVGIVITGIMYVVIGIVAVTLVAPADLARSSGPLLDVVTAAGVSFPPKLFAVIALLAITNTALINMIMASRVLYGMANEGIVPSVFARVHAKRKTPFVAIGFTVAIAALLIASGTVEVLAETTVLLLLLVFALVNVAVLVVRKRPVKHSHFTTHPWIAITGAIGALVLASPLTGRSGRAYLIAAILVGAGALLWGVNRLLGGSGRKFHGGSA